MIPSDVRTLATDVLAVARERQISVKSAGLAYHAFNTLVPLVILLFVAVTLIESLEVLLEALETATGLEGTISRDQLDQAAGDGANRTRAGLLALGILLWSAARLFQAVNSAFTAVYDSRQSQSSIEAALSASFVTFLYAFLLTVTVAVGVALVGILGVSTSIFFDGPLAMAASTAALTGLLFVPMYYVFPEPDVSVREVLPGTAFAAVTWSLLAVGFRIYVLTSESVALFDIAGAILLILTWVYFGGFCLLLGAVLNAVLADRVDPDDGWVPMSEELSKAA